MDQNHERLAMSSIPNLSIVVCCYNEHEVLPETHRQLIGLIGALLAAGKIAESSAVYFVDDGSRDQTWTLIEQLSSNDPHVVGIKLSRNRGHQNALLAGLFAADGDAVVSIDADLQDDVSAIEKMLDRFMEGADIVYGVRRKRDTDSPSKRITAAAFYRLLRSLGAETIYNHADYRLMSRRAVEGLKQYREVNLYLRGIVPLLGFHTEVVRYDRRDRFAGETKYPTRKLIALALEAITSFSVVPLRLITLTGFAVFGGSIVVSLWVLWVRLFSNEAVPGWASVVLPMYLLGGTQLFCIGMLGEYLGKTYAEVKGRPRYIVEKIVGTKARSRGNLTAPGLEIPI